MALDGIVIHALVEEWKHELQEGRIYKIYQPEPDEVILVIKTPRGNKRLLLSSSATLPLAYLTEETKENPMTAPTFCMLLRKHIGNGRIVDITQPRFERIIVFTIEHLDEMGDLCRKQLILEIMGKHSNLIFTDEEGKILDSIKRVSAQVSSVREVLPGRDYVAPPAGDKADPLTLERGDFLTRLSGKSMQVSKAIYTGINGFSPQAAEELCYRAGVEGDTDLTQLSEEQKEKVCDAVFACIEEIKAGTFAPAIYYDAKEEPVEYAAISLSMYRDLREVSFESSSKMLEVYYADKSRFTRIRQKSADLRKVVATVLEREVKKLDLQEKQMKDTEKRDTYRIYGELLNTYGYSAAEGDKSITVPNHYTGEEITIPLDPELSASDNALKYFKRYTKLKRTYEAMEDQIRETREKVEHLQSIQTALNLSKDEADLADVRKELEEFGYVRKHGGKGTKERSKKSKPLHYISSDGFHIYVGKNNYQNEEVTFKIANGADLWFHAKQMPGSHVIVKTEGKEELPDRLYEEAGRLAAYYSSGNDAEKVEIDYTRRRELKKTPGGAPGFVIYHTNYSLVASPDLRGLTLVTE